jgi:hypothetical protein
MLPKNTSPSRVVEQETSMKARSAWPSGFLVLFLGCSSGAIGTGDTAQGTGTGSSLGSSGSVGGGGLSGTPICTGCTVNDAGTVITADGAVAAPPSVNPPHGGVVSQVITKLTDIEYANTVNDLLGIPASQQTVSLGADSSSGGFFIGGASTDQTADAYQSSALQIATLATSATNLPSLLKAANCTAPAGNAGADGAACAAAFINEFAPLAFRHGLVDAATLAGLTALYTAVAVTQAQGFTEGVSAVIQEILQSPYFLYHLETEQQSLGMYGTAIPVTGYSMANRLSYLLWSSMPDSTLFAAAAANELLTPGQVSAQATRMVQDPKAKIGLRNFYQQWLLALSLPDGKVGTSSQILPSGTLSNTSLFQTTKGESFATVYSAALQQAIFDSFNMQVDNAMWAGANVMKTLLTGATVYTNAVLAPVFGVTGVTGTVLQAAQVDTTKREGILSHPLIMATQATTATSHPVFRGRYVWDQIVCQALPDPPAGVPAFVPPAAGMSLRQDFELLTATGPYAGKVSADPSIPCPSCHTRLDPIGFLYESFDTIGDWRTIDDYGAPVDLTNITIVQSLDKNLNVLTPNTVQFAENLANSDLPNACMTAYFYRFMAKRNDAMADYPVEAWLDQVFDYTGQNLTPVLIGLTQTDVFLDRMNSQ